MLFVLAFELFRVLNRETHLSVCRVIHENTWNFALSQRALSTKTVVHISLTCGELVWCVGALCCLASMTVKRFGCACPSDGVAAEGAVLRFPSALAHLLDGVVAGWDVSDGAAHGAGAVVRFVEGGADSAGPVGVCLEVTAGWAVTVERLAVVWVVDGCRCR